MEVKWAQSRALAMKEVAQVEIQVSSINKTLVNVSECLGISVQVQAAPHRRWWLLREQMKSMKSSGNEKRGPRAVDDCRRFQQGLEISRYALCHA